ncbi:MAG: TetR family transcriptional regulator [Coriobacteriaceae bacterium]|nr:TetR family transcriptional regulator [Coriobacteriaceae bacterium]
MKKNGDTKAAMAQALRTCMQDAPIDRISIKTITDACGLNRQTFYYHFKDIYDLVKWMYIRDINDAIQLTENIESWEESLYQLLLAFDNDRECYLAIYNSRNYYPTLRTEIIGCLTEKFEPIFRNYFDEAGFDDVYREFLLRMYALVVFEFIERHARGIAYSTIEDFAHNWVRTILNQLEGARAANSGH